MSQLTFTWTSGRARHEYTDLAETPSIGELVTILGRSFVVTAITDSVEVHPV